MAPDSPSLTWRALPAAALACALLVVLWVGSAAAHQRVAGSMPAPRRIVSLVPAATEMLFAIGAGPQVVGVGSFDSYPEETARLPKVGALLDPDVERILSLKPDLVVIYGSQTDLRQQLERAGIRRYEYRHAGLADVTSTMRALGDATAHSAQATALAAAIDRELDGIRTKVHGLPRPRTLLVFGHERGALRGIYASGGVGFLHDMLTVAGGDNVFADVKRQAVRTSTEMLIARAPDVVLDLHYSRQLTAAAIEKERGAWQLIPSVPAVRNGRIHIMLGDHLVVPGPRIGAAAEEFSRALHPEVWRN
jgi:iron complex transport system substrate-binding protein